MKPHHSFVYTLYFALLRRNCLLQQVIEGKIKRQIEVTRRRGRRRKKLLDDLKDRRWYCQLKEGALDRTMWRNRFGRGFGPVVWQITDDDDDDILPSFACGLFSYFFLNFGNFPECPFFKPIVFLACLWMKTYFLGQPYAGSEMNQRPNSDSVLPGQRWPMLLGTVILIN